MVAKLKNECGIHYTKKIESMLKDFRLSLELNSDFHQQIEAIFHEDLQFQENYFEMKVHVLTTGFWPFEQIHTCRLPDQIISWKQFFEEFYSSKFKGKRLKWITNYGIVNLRANLNGKKKEFICSTN